MFNTSLLADFEIPERRKDQFYTDSGYYVVPTPYSIPGIGGGIILVGAVTNYKDYSDIYGFAAAGDLEGIGIISAENHLIKETLIIDFALQSFNKASSQVYTERGMGAAEGDYFLAELDNALFYGSRLTYTMHERKLEFYGMVFDNEAKAGALRNPDGSLIQAASDAETVAARSITVGVRLDLTDDYNDPRKGFRLEGSFWHSPPLSQDSPDYNIFDLNITGYVPVSKNDSVVLNYFQADTQMNRIGETETAVLEANQGYDCAAIPDPSLQQYCNNLITSTAAHNTYGSVGALGGLSRLRSYPGGRFEGSHARFYGIEYRWNINDDNKPFDIFIAKDIRTVMQVAFFYERGAISDDKSELWNRMAYSAGIGFRMVTSSGVVFRADVANGDEGSEISVIVGYPWEVF